MAEYKKMYYVGMAKRLKQTWKQGNGQKPQQWLAMFGACKAQAREDGKKKERELFWNEKEEINWHKRVKVDKSLAQS